MTSFNLQLSPFERRLMSFYRRSGPLGMIGLVTLISVFGSVAIVMGIVYPFAGDDVSVDGLWYFLGGSIGVPLVIAPLATLLLTRLLVLLDKSFQIMESLSTTDPLTGSANRRGFFALAEQSVCALRGGSRCCVGMVDLDNFKILNDTHGHQSGDSALVRVSQELKVVVGKSGAIGRIGGDEFALLIIAESEHLRVFQNTISTLCENLSVTTTGGVEVQLSASVGFALLEDGQSFDEALGNADAFLYKNKKDRKREWRSATRQDAVDSSNQSLIHKDVIASL